MPVVDIITSFIEEIGLQVVYEEITEKTFLPGICLRNGTLVIDKEKLLHPGDILHEAGHLAVMPAEIRYTMNDSLDDNPIHQGGETMAIAWSYAACIHLRMDPHIVFHEHGYKNGGKHIVENFSAGRYFGVSLLQWSGMTYEEKKAKDMNVKPYPDMVTWLCMQNNYD